MAYGYPPLPTLGGAVTGEAVSVELRPARLGSRTVALAIDFVAQFVIGFVLTLGAGALSLNLDSDLVGTISLIVLLVIVFGYPIILETIWSGRTLGKAVMGLRVVRDDGGPAPFTSIFVRELVGYLLEKPGIFFGVLGAVTMTSSERAKRLGDMLAGTIVISTRIPGGTIPPVPMPPPLAGWAANADLSRVPDSLGLGIRQFLGRSGQLDPVARDRVGEQLVAQLRPFVSPPPPPGTPGWAFLSAVVAERRRRDELARSQHVAPTYTSVDTGAYGAMPAFSQRQQPQAAPPPPPAPGPGGFVAPG